MRPSQLCAARSCRTCRRPCACYPCGPGRSGSGQRQTPLASARSRPKAAVKRQQLPEPAFCSLKLLEVQCWTPIA
eukprot:15447277-Alexandrium_andersonii.AAC.1